MPAMQGIWESPMTFNSHSDARLTKSGGLPFDVWVYIFRLENRCHGEPAVKDAEVNPADWRDAYGDDYTPHDALEEDFNAGCS